MNLLFNKKGNNKVNPNEPYKRELPYDIKYSLTPDGRFQVDYHNKSATNSNRYDTTRLIISHVVQLDSKNPIYNCYVSYYNQQDAIMLIKGKKVSSRDEYRNILAEFDFNRLKNPQSNYCQTLMEELLNRDRVDRYLENGMRERSDLECGNYVGGLGIKDGIYEKYFDKSIGRIIHNSKYIRLKRREYMNRKEAERKEKIEHREGEIKNLENQLKELKEKDR